MPKLVTPVSSSDSETVPDLSRSIARKTFLRALDSSSSMKSSGASPRTQPIEIPAKKGDEDALVTSLQAKM
eukprot:scaffold54510_cov35-Tisochrysis_lutea.AAC.2